MGKTKTKNLDEIKTTIRETATGKLVLHLSMTTEDLDDLCLQGGKQPKGIFETIIVHRRES